MTALSPNTTEILVPAGMDKDNEEVLVPDDFKPAFFFGCMGVGFSDVGPCLKRQVSPSLHPLFDLKNLHFRVFFFDTGLSSLSSGLTGRVFPSSETHTRKKKNTCTIEEDRRRHKKTFCDFFPKLVHRRDVALYCLPLLLGFLMPCPFCSPFAAFVRVFFHLQNFRLMGFSRLRLGTTY